MSGEYGSFRSRLSYMLDHYTRTGRMIDGPLRWLLGWPGWRPLRSLRKRFKLG
jgi:hypothetical protein